MTEIMRLKLNNYGFYQSNSSIFELRGNNTVRGNTIADGSETITGINRF